jgi:protein-S-isoprenylcysteine O-methyltransferase Ste14
MKQFGRIKMANSSTAPHNAPNTVPWPPILFGTAAIVGVCLHWLIPLGWVAGASRFALLMVGVLLMAAAVALEISAALAFRKARTSILPHRAATNLVTSGPFQFTRNPIYLGNTMLVAGAGLVFGVGWLLVAAIAAAVAVHFLAVLREERHLSITFGDEWRRYAQRVPRWIGLA